MTTLEIIGLILFFTVIVIPVVWMTIDLGSNSDPTYDPLLYLSENDSDIYDDDEEENPYTNCGHSETLSFNAHQDPTDFNGDL